LLTIIEIILFFSNKTERVEAKDDINIRMIFSLTDKRDTENQKGQHWFILKTKDQF